MDFEVDRSELTRENNMFIRWIVYTRNKKEAKNIFEDALCILRNHMKRCQFLSDKPYWKFDR